MYSKRYETAISTVCSAALIAEGKGLTDFGPRELEVHNLAYHCDRLAGTLANTAKHMAEKFTRYAAEVDAVESLLRDLDAPTNTSALADITRMNAELQMTRQHLFTLVRVVYGPDSSKALRAALVAGGAK